MSSAITSPRIAIPPSALGAWTTTSSLVFTPTCSSWLNWIEAEFAALRHFALNGTDHHTHPEQNAAIDAYIRWHNTQAQAKSGFATDSPIRTWTQLPDQGCLTSH